MKREDQDGPGSTPLPGTINLKIFIIPFQYLEISAGVGAGWSGAVSLVFSFIFSSVLEDLACRPLEQEEKIIKYLSGPNARRPFILMYSTGITRKRI